ncbi:Calcium permeable stress-gated cation channel 1 [Podosphaera aphanis]|nr:Calcium permeable stress-gated cation channel 1 [Podosphaera aphanis]
MVQYSSTKECKHYDPFDPHSSEEQRYVQPALSLALGLSAFFGFCFLRPRWKSMYAARKRQSNVASSLPELPDTFFGWIPVLYRVTEDEVLRAAGLDAYFLAFFKMSIKLFGTILLIAFIILAPINNHFDWFPTLGSVVFPGSDEISQQINSNNLGVKYKSASIEEYKKDDLPDPTYLWAYLFFTYVFTGLAIYFMISQTKLIIKVRQEYLGKQSSVTNRTFKLSGIPPELRYNSKIKAFIESLQIGSVESVAVVRNWKQLDILMKKRAFFLRKLEKAWATYLERQKIYRNLPEEIQTSIPQIDPEVGSREIDVLLGQSYSFGSDKLRPSKMVWYGFLNCQVKRVDAIDYYQEKLQELDNKISNARKKEYPSTPLAFVTMDSISACQTAVQVLLYQSPRQLLARLAPAPSDIVWHNTYLSRYNRIVRAWIITLFIIILTIFWVVPVAALAGLLDLCSIRQVWPQLADFLANHDILQSLVQTGLPTLIVSLLNIGVPFLYDYLSNQQGMISQDDVELSLISKNFFFTFFNVFLTFTVAGTATKFWSTLHDSLKDTTFLAFKLAGSVQQVAVFFTNLILLQGVGLIPFRLLEFGSVSLYPIMLMSSKTPRDFNELEQPPVFKYGFYLPSAILVYILCIVYSILPAGYKVLTFGLIYFINSYYTYKYQLLYAMDHSQHATGGVWPMICYRILLGLGVFQIIMAGIIALKNQIYAAGLVVPLIPFTIWYSYYFARSYHPLLKFIAIESIYRGTNDSCLLDDENIENRGSSDQFCDGGINIDSEIEQGSQFINSSLTVPLAKLWVDNLPETANETNNVQGAHAKVLSPGNSAASSLSLGDTHVWRDTSRDTTEDI